MTGEILELITTLKRALKAEGLTYAEVAKRLGLSEANIKRMFSTRSISLNRLNEICQLINMEISDLVFLMETERHQISHLTREQEKELVSNDRFLLVALCVYNYWSFKDIIDNYVIPETECIQYLAKLDRLGLIDLLPHNRIKLRVAKDFRWLPQGPIERFFENNVQNDFFKSSFSNEGEIRIYLSGELSGSSHNQLLRKLNELANEFTDMNNNDAVIPLKNKQHIGMLLALRPWGLPAFRELRRK